MAKHSKMSRSEPNENQQLDTVRERTVRPWLLCALFRHTSVIEFNSRINFTHNRHVFSIAHPAAIFREPEPSHNDRKVGDSVNLLGWNSSI
jgi:hypothetical protein